jgi:hypothetical protein
MMAGASRPAPEFLGKIPPGGLLVGRAVPVTVRAATALLSVSEYGDTGIVLVAGPPDADYPFTSGKGFELKGGTPGPLALEVRSGEMPILPNEEFDLTLTEADGRPQQSRVTAGQDGVVRISLETTGCVTIEMHRRGPVGGGAP